MTRILREIAAVAVVIVSLPLLFVLAIWMAGAEPASPDETHFKPYW